MKRRTKQELEYQVLNLEPYREFYLCRHETPKKLSSGEVSIEIVGLLRPAGGVVLLDDCNVMFAIEWCQLSSVQGCPYKTEIANKIRKLQKDVQILRLTRKNRFLWASDYPLLTLEQLQERDAKP